MVAIAVLGAVFSPVPEPGSEQQALACRGSACRPAPTAQRWTAALPGTWMSGGLTGTVPATGAAYVAAGGGVAAVGAGLTVTAYTLSRGRLLWQVTLAGFRTGSVIMSVRAWPGAVTVGVAGPSGTARTEVVIDSVTGGVLRRYPSALFGGAVAAAASATVVIGPAAVTSYDNSTGAIRWQRPTGAGQAWRVDGGTLYVTESAGGYLRSSPVTGLRVIALASGAERALVTQSGQPFAGTLAGAADGAVLFTSDAGVTAYSGLTGDLLWSRRDAVPEGTDPGQGLVYLTSASGALLGADPLTGRVRASVVGSTEGGSGGMYVVRGGVALGLDHGQDGDAWGYSVAAGRVTWTAPGLPWPHYFSDVSGLGGSAAQTGDIVVIAACKRLASTPAARPTAPPPVAGTQASSPGVSGTESPGTESVGTESPGTEFPGAAPLSARSATDAGASAPSPASSPSPSPSPSATPSARRLCAVPVLVALSV